MGIKAERRKVKKEIEKDVWTKRIVPLDCGLTADDRIIMKSQKSQEKITPQEKSRRKKLNKYLYG